MSLQTPEPQEVGSDAGLSGAAAPDAARPSRARRLLRRLSWLWVLLAGVGAYLLLLRTLLVTENPNFFPSLILLGSIVVPAAVLTFAATGGKRGIRVNAGIVTFTVIAGGVLGTVAAGTLEYDTLRALDALPMIMVALIEEASKILVPAAVLADQSTPPLACGRRSRSCFRYWLRNARDHGLRLYCPTQRRFGRPRRDPAAARPTRACGSCRLDGTVNGGHRTDQG
jgi:hypothetical protein